MITKIMTVIKRVAQRLEVEPTPGGDGDAGTENGKIYKENEGCVADNGGLGKVKYMNSIKLISSFTRALARGDDPSAETNGSVKAL